MNSCLFCGSMFTKVKPWQKYCTKKCKDTEFKKRNPDAISKYNKKQSYTPKFKYHVHKNGAKRRGIEFNLTFEQWWELWEPYWESRGKQKDSLVMCRVGDSGNYEVGNVYIDTYSKNSREAALNFPRERDKITGRFI